MLVSAVMPQGLSVYIYSGHVVNLPQDVAHSLLPRLPSQRDVIVVRKEGASFLSERTFIGF